MAGLVNIVQVLLPRIGEGLGYDADQIIIDHVEMISDLDILRSANLLIDQHGEDAGLEAAMRADAMLEKGVSPRRRVTRSRAR